jgi:glycosyltransferase involved in cell wall biosynthesis
MGVNSRFPFIQHFCVFCEFCGLPRAASGARISHCPGSPILQYSRFVNVVYDLQAYSFSPHGGIARIFDEMLRAFARRRDFSARLIRTHALQRVPPLAENVRFAEFPDLPLQLHKYRLIGGAYSQLEKRYWKKQAIDIYHPTFYPFHDRFDALPCVVNVYDLIHERIEGADDMPDHRGFLKRKARFIEKADRLICISEATRHDLLACYKVDPQRVRVVHLGGNPVFRNMDDADAQAKCRALLKDFDKPFILYVGSRQRYKNFHLFMQAYGRWARRKDIGVVVVGGPARAEDRLVLDLSGSPAHVRFVGHTDDETLCALYNRAEFFVYPSRLEGFGIPLLEAMASGCPLCCSDIPVFREIAKDLPAYFDPSSAESAVAAFDKALTLRGDTRLVKLQADRAGQFTWQQCTDKIWQVYKEIAPT